MWEDSIEVSPWEFLFMVPIYLAMAAPIIVAVFVWLIWREVQRIRVALESQATPPASATHPEDA